MVKTTSVDIEIGNQCLEGQIVEPATGLPGILFVHGWAGNQKRDEKRSRAFARFGCICLTFDMRGHGATWPERKNVTRSDNLEDICAAYDKLAGHPAVDNASIAVIASSYGAYLATFLTTRRGVRWLAMRVPALYRDENWDVPKHALDRQDLQRFRSELVPFSLNRALQNCHEFLGDVLIVESENDELVPHSTIASYLASFGHARSMTHRIISGADHALSDTKSRRAYDEVLLRWIKEMVLSAR